MSVYTCTTLVTITNEKHSIADSSSMTLAVPPLLLYFALTRCKLFGPNC